MSKLNRTFLLSSLVVVALCTANTTFGEEVSLTKKQIDSLTEIFKISNAIKSDADQIMDCIRDTALEAVVYASSGDVIHGKTGEERGLSLRAEVIDIQKTINLALRGISHVAYTLTELSALTAKAKIKSKNGSFSTFHWLNDRLQLEHEESTVLLDGAKSNAKKQLHELFFEHPVCGQADGVEGVTVETLENNLKINSAKIKELVKELN